MKNNKRQSIKKLALMSAWSVPVVRAVTLPAHAQTSQMMLFDGIQIGLAGFACSSVRPQSVNYFFEIELTLNDEIITNPSLEGLEIEIIFNALENERVFLARKSTIRFKNEVGSAYFEITVSDRMDFALAQISTIEPTSGEIFSILDGFDINRAWGGDLTC